MTSIQLAPHNIRHALRHLLRSPKGYMLLWMGAITALGAIAEGTVVVPGLLGGIGAAATTDISLSLVLRRRLILPDGAVLTGIVCALVLDPYAPPTVAVVAAVIGIASKRLLRLGPANVFNPAALGLVSAHALLGNGESWWGALPDYGLIGVLLILVPGGWIADHVNKLPMVLAFLATYLGLSMLAALGPRAVEVAEVFQTPGIQMAVFFACYMLDDPPTSPNHYRDQIWFGLLVGMVAYAFFIASGVVYFLPAALLVGNLTHAIHHRLTAHHPSHMRPSATG